MSTFSLRSLAGNPDLEQAETDAAVRDDARIPFASGLPDNVRAEMDEAFGYGTAPTDAEMDADADARRNDEAALLAQWPTVATLSDFALINVVATAPACEPFDEFTAACVIEAQRRVDGVTPRRPE